MAPFHGLRTTQVIWPTSAVEEAVPPVRPVEPMPPALVRNQLLVEMHQLQLAIMQILEVVPQRQWVQGQARAEMLLLRLVTTQMQLPLMPPHWALNQE